MYENLSLEQKVERLLDIQQIRNLMGKYEYYGFNNDPESIVAMFSTREDAYVDCEGIGVLEGPAGIRKFFVDWHKSLNGELDGVFAIHAVTTEVIEVAEDGKTARGIWISPGAEAKHSVSGQLESYWIWGKYPVDFIKEDGEWKFWKFRIPHDLLCDFHHSWTDLGVVEVLGGDIESEEEKPVGDRPSVYPENFYNPRRPASAFFVPPLPYGTERELEGFWGEPYTLDDEEGE